MRITFLLLSAFFVPLLLLGQQEPVTITDAAGNHLYTLQNNKLLLHEHDYPDTLYTVQGNLILKGASTQKEDIMLVVDDADLFDKKGGQVLGSKMSQAKYLVNQGAFYLSVTAEVDNILGYFQKTDEGGYLFRDGETDSVLLKFNGDVSTGQLTAIAQAGIVRNKLVQRVNDRIPDNVIPLEPKKDYSNTSGSIRKLWGSAETEFEWDGQVLRPKWSYRDFLEWEFDGLILRRVWYNDGDEFIWDGETLKRRWYNSPDEFVWNGRTIRRKWDSNDEFIVQGNIVKRPWDASGQHEWQVSGEVPIPIIILVVYGLVGR